MVQPGRAVPGEVGRVTSPLPWIAEASGLTGAFARGSLDHTQTGGPPGVSPNYSGSVKVLGSTFSTGLNSVTSCSMNFSPSRLLSTLVAFMIPPNSL